MPSSGLSKFFFFNEPAPSEISTLSLHDSLPISTSLLRGLVVWWGGEVSLNRPPQEAGRIVLDHLGMGLGQPLDKVELGEDMRSEEHTSELQSRQYLVCRLLLEKKKHAKSVCS